MHTHELLSTAHPGHRLAAVTVLQVLPDPEHLPWLVERIAAEKPFIGYHAAVALLAAARESPVGDLPRVEEALVQAEAASWRLRPDTDRATTLRFVRDELDRRTAGRGRSN